MNNSYTSKKLFVISDIPDDVYLCMTSLAVGLYLPVWKKSYERPGSYSSLYVIKLQFMAYEKIGPVLDQLTLFEHKCYGNN